MNYDHIHPVQKKTSTTLSQGPIHLFIIPLARMKTLDYHWQNFGLVVCALCGLKMFPMTSVLTFSPRQTIDLENWAKMRQIQMSDV